MIGLLDQFSDSEPVLIDAATGESITKADIAARAKLLQENALGGRFAFLFCESTIDSIHWFHAAFEAGLVVALMDPNSDSEMLASLLDAYQPDALLGSIPLDLDSGFDPVIDGLYKRTSGTRLTPPHPDLSILLTTSGSTGSPKLVRLSRSNIVSNAKSIASSLALTKSDRAVTALPPFYSFGMSVITSHAVVGSPVVVTASGLLEPIFWEQLAQYGVTCFPGVPQTYVMLKRLRFIDRQLPHLPELRALLQAGGRLEPLLVEEFATAMSAHGGSLFVMYGQTEASPRITCLPPQSLMEKMGSVGVPLKGGQLEIHGDEGPIEAESIGEVVYCGPNVMMGYAQSRVDLALGDTQGECLHTGDLGYLDPDGFLYLTGRVSRIAKVAGVRISLDEVESIAQALSPVAVVEGKDGQLCVFTTNGLDTKAAQRELALKLRIATKSIEIRVIDQLPRLSNGKVNYPLLSELAQEPL
jgi:acyl-CoA synthetase (AMP-forming)/AMP-acid ligase II